MRVLIVDDEVRLTRHISSALTEAGHDPAVVRDGEAALRAATATPFDLLVLDVGLPQMDGFEVLKRLRSQHVPSRVLMLTARGELNDRITGLQLGADDYLPKPFAMQELVARVRALSRRYAEEPALNLRADDLTLNLADHTVYRGEQKLELSTRELTLLKVLCASRAACLPARNYANGCGNANMNTTPNWWKFSSVACAKNSVNRRSFRPCARDPRELIDPAATRAEPGDFPPARPAAAAAGSHCDGATAAVRKPARPRE